MVKFWKNYNIQPFFQNCSHIVDSASPLYTFQWLYIFVRDRGIIESLCRTLSLDQVPQSEALPFNIEDIFPAQMEKTCCTMTNPKRHIDQIQMLFFL